MAKNKREVELSYYRKRALENYRRNSNVVTGIEILVAPDSCEACKELTGKKFTLENVPDLPNLNCTHEKGCRCCYIPITILSGWPGRNTK
jgi:hypothetical protein